jgi:transcriptional regulator with XRE-family HTH domain
MPSPARPGQTPRRRLAVALLDDGRERQAIAAAAGIAPQTLSGIVTGRIRHPKPETTRAIAQVLGRAERELFDDTAAPDLSPARQRLAQGLPAELTDEQVDLIGRLVAVGLRRARSDHNPAA